MYNNLIPRKSSIQLKSLTSSSVGEWFTSKTALLRPFAGSFLERVILWFQIALTGLDIIRRSLAEAIHSLLFLRSFSGRTSSAETSYCVCVLPLVRAYQKDILLMVCLQIQDLPLRESPIQFAQHVRADHCTKASIYQNPTAQMACRLHPRPKLRYHQG
jgi:hypothetical protein